MPKVSIIVPIYNVEKFLSRCLESLINQTLKDIEIICINDGSTDNSHNILKRYAQKDNRIIILKQNNKGVAAARNLGLKNAQSDYIGFIDSDDWIDLNYFEKLYDAIKNTDSDIACCSIKRVYKYKKSWRLKVNDQIIITDTQEKFNYLNIPSQCFTVNKLYKKNELEKFKLKFIEGKYYEDIPFTIECITKLKKMVTVPDICYYYWSNKQSIVKLQNNRKRMDFIWAWDYMLNFVRNNNIKINYKDEIKRKYCYSFCGITILKKYKWDTEETYLLFGILPILNIKIY